MIDVVMALARRLTGRPSAEDLILEIGTLVGDAGTGAVLAVQPSNPRLAMARVARDPGGQVLFVELDLAPGADLTMQQLERALGPWRELPNLSVDRPPSHAFPWLDEPGAAATVAIFARLAAEPGETTPDSRVAELLLRRDLR
jgi:hypothetical protein